MCKTIDLNIQRAFCFKNLVYFLILLATSNVISKYKACGFPKEMENGFWEATSEVEIWDKYVESRTIIQQVQYICNPNYQLVKGEKSFVNCNHGNNSFTPDPPQCELDTGQSVLLNFGEKSIKHLNKFLAQHF